MNIVDLIAQDDAARAADTVIGRFIAIPYEYKGWSFYQAVRETETGWEMQHVPIDGIPDIRMPDLDSNGSVMERKSVLHYIAFNRGGWEFGFPELNEKA